MDQEYFLLLLAIATALFIAALSVRRRRVAGSLQVAVLALVVALWNLTYLLARLPVVAIPNLLFVALGYLFSAVAASTLLAFVLVYGNRTAWIKPAMLILLAIEPVITQALIWIGPLRRLLFMEAGGVLTVESGPWAHFHGLYLYTLELVSLLVLADRFYKRPRSLLLEFGAVMAGAAAPLLFRLLNQVLQSPGDLFGHTVIGYVVTMIGLAFGLYRISLVEVVPVTYESVVKGMSDGWMVLDLNNHIIDVNAAAERIVGIPRQSLFGKPIRSVLPDWPNLSEVAGEGRELEMRRSVRAQGNWRYLNVRVSNLRDEHGSTFGQLIIWRDITERKLAEEARQRARDEMFVLLNAISNAASHSIKLDDFLTESIYQIIYPFQSQMVVVYLSDEEASKNQGPLLRLTSYFGLASESVAAADMTFVPAPALQEVISSKQPLVVEKAEQVPGLPGPIQQLSMAGLVLLPLYTQAGEDSKLLGVMILGRKEPNPYTPDEVIRLTAIAEQIANLIDSDRRRQLAIALSEREKLMRDLHDSVSQKLYGLVTLTEAAQAGIEAGSKVVPAQVLAKIGENARQAVKEMRLFLYQMQPVDLEKGSLVSALHHRLGAVEGRADIQARFLPDENISISRDKSIALYFIAQEALNNILKHAHANTVLVRLRQTRTNVLLEITDNGRGFDPKAVDQGGMGLQNMRARTAQIHGKLKIVSKPNEGTTIRVTVPREGLPANHAHRKNGSSERAPA